MANQLTDLNNHLFAQLDRLANKDLTPDEIEQEVSRTAAIVKVADQVISNADLTLSACKLVAEHGDHFMKRLPMLSGQTEEMYGQQDYEGPKK